MKVEAVSVIRVKIDTDMGVIQIRDLPSSDSRNAQQNTARDIDSNRPHKSDCINDKDQKNSGFGKNLNLTHDRRPRSWLELSLTETSDTDEIGEAVAWRWLLRQASIVITFLDNEDDRDQNSATVCEDKP